MFHAVRCNLLPCTLSSARRLRRILRGMSSAAHGLFHARTHTRAHTLRRIGMVGCGAGSGGSQAGGRGAVPAATGLSRARRRRRLTSCCTLSAACCLHNAFRLISFVVPRCPLQLASPHAVCGTSSVPHSPGHVVCRMPSTTRCACPPLHVALLHVVYFARARTRARTHTLRRIGMVWCGAGAGGSQAGGRGAVPAATGLSRARRRRRLTEPIT